MKIAHLRERVRVLMPTNGGQTRLVMERFGGEIEIETRVIPPQLRRIESRFVVNIESPSPEEQDTVEELRAACRVYIEEHERG